jgi:hypothetical protein
MVSVIARLQSGSRCESKADPGKCPFILFIDEYRDLYGRSAESEGGWKSHVFDVDLSY